MTGDELIRRLKHVARSRGLVVRFEPGAGKGSHGRLYLGDAFTTLKDRRKEIGPGLLRAMRRQLGIDPRDLEG